MSRFTLTPSQERALRLIAEGRGGAAHYTSCGILQTLRLVRLVHVTKCTSRYELTLVGRAHLDAIDERDRRIAERLTFESMMAGVKS